MEDSVKKERKERFLNMKQRDNVIFLREEYMIKLRKERKSKIFAQHRKKMVQAQAAMQAVDDMDSEVSECEDMDMLDKELPEKECMLLLLKLSHDFINEYTNSPNPTLLPKIKYILKALTCSYDILVSELDSILNNDFLSIDKLFDEYYLFIPIILENMSEPENEDSFYDTSNNLKCVKYLLCLLLLLQQSEDYAQRIFNQKDLIRGVYQIISTHCNLVSYSPQYGDKETKVSSEEGNVGIPPSIIKIALQNILLAMSLMYQYSNNEEKLEIIVEETSFMELCPELLRIASETNLPLLWNCISYILGSIASTRKIEVKDVPEVCELFNENLRSPHSTNLCTLFAISLFAYSEEIATQFPTLFKLSIELPLWHKSDGIYEEDSNLFGINFKEVCFEILLTHFCSNSEYAQILAENDFWPQIKELIKDPNLEDIIGHLAVIVESPKYY
ncbi:unnamed protein product [Moneuplotes crassus]|uniref:Uncharacterized protein n=1 Tax=Euplotes crassus TaxID=5936 RepID=A0AAD1UAM8_EUPCR|nr:unnamed protein product [Moneuplotes crassus]